MADDSEAATLIANTADHDDWVKNVCGISPQDYSSTAPDPSAPVTSQAEPGAAPQTQPEPEPELPPPAATGAAPTSDQGTEGTTITGANQGTGDAGQAAGNPDDNGGAGGASNTGDNQGTPDTGQTAGGNPDDDGGAAGASNTGDNQGTPDTGQAAGGNPDNDGGASGASNTGGNQGTPDTGQAAGSNPDSTGGAGGEPGNDNSGTLPAAGDGGAAGEPRTDSGGAQGTGTGTGEPGQPGSPPDLSSLLPTIAIDGGMDFPPFKREIWGGKVELSFQGKYHFQGTTDGPAMGATGTNDGDGRGVKIGAELWGQSQQELWGFEIPAPSVSATFVKNENEVALQLVLVRKESWFTLEVDIYVGHSLASGEPSKPGTVKASLTAESKVIRNQTIAGFSVKEVSFSVIIEVVAAPNWQKILADELVKQAEKKALQAAGEAVGEATGEAVGETAGEATGEAAAETTAEGGAELATAEGTGAVVSSGVVAGIVGGIAGGVLLCIGVCRAIGKLNDLGADATETCQSGERELRAYAEAYAATMRGGSGGNAQGNADAEAALGAIMAKTPGLTHDGAVQAAVASGQRYEDLAYRAVLPQMRQRITAAYKEKEGTLGWLTGQSTFMIVLNDILDANSHY